MPTATAEDGAEIAYEATGAGPVLVLVHGITECRRSWDPLVETLALDAKVVAVDLRGHGESERRPPYDAFTMAADLDAVVRAAGAREPLMVGHSLGGVVVSAYAANHPARGVVNIDQALMLGGFHEVLVDVEPALRGDDATFRATVEAMFTMLDGPLSPSERARLDAGTSVEQDVVLGVWETVLTSDAAQLDALIARTVATIEVPYLAVHGRDPGDEYRAWLARTFPAAAVEVWDGDGHYPHLVEPERFLARLHEFDHEL
jgi:pimeloyl-ACP methyl ester carboxylesterase